MKSRTIVLLLALLVVSAPAAFSQEALQNPGQANPAEQPSAQNIATVPPSNVLLPEGNEVWVVLVRRTGGFAGVSLEITVNSTGKLSCELCKDERIRKLSGTALRSATPTFSFGVAPVDIPTQADPTTSVPISFCQDCFRTHITIQRRDAAGKVETYAALWDDITSGRQPAEFVRLAKTILDLAK